MTTAYVLGRFKVNPTWKREDLPPNENGFSYTTFRDPKGNCVAVYRTDFLVEEWDYEYEGDFDG